MAGGKCISAADALYKITCSAEGHDTNILGSALHTTIGFGYL